MVTALQWTNGHFTDRLEQFLRAVECRRLVESSDLEAVYRLRYNAYRREDAIAFDRRRRFHDEFDDMDNLWTFGLYMDGELLSSIRIHVASPEHPYCPAATVFPDLLSEDIEAGRTIVDPTRFVTDKKAANTYPELLYATVRLAFVTVQHFVADVALATVRAEHQVFYRGFLGFRPACMPRNYPTLIKPIMLMSIRECQLRVPELITRYQFLSSAPEERANLFGDAPAVEPLPFVRAPEPQQVDIQEAVKRKVSR